MLYCLPQIFTWLCNVSGLSIGESPMLNYPTCLLSTRLCRNTMDTEYCSTTAPPFTAVIQYVQVHCNLCTALYCITKYWDAPFTMCSFIAPHQYKALQCDSPHHLHQFIAPHNKALYCKVLSANQCNDSAALHMLNNRVLFARGPIWPDKTTKGEL